MYKLLNSTFMSLLELPLLESSNSKADFIGLATNIEMFLSSWIFHFFFPHCKNRHTVISIKDTILRSRAVSSTLKRTYRLRKCRISIALTVPAHLLVAKLQNTFELFGFSYMKTVFGESVQTNIYGLEVFICWQNRHYIMRSNLATSSLTGNLKNLHVLLPEDFSFLSL